MKRNARLILCICISAGFLLLDQLLKQFAQANQAFSWYITKPWVGWEYLENPGIAFSLPFPNIILILFTPIILLGLFVLLTRQNKTSLQSFGILLIIGGAVSNLIDRILFAVTIDYLRIFTSVINIADVMIVAGAALLLAHEIKRKKMKHTTHP